MTATTEIPLSIPTESGIVLEARLAAGASQPKAPPRVAVVCHPHPLFGGDMHNNVVMVARETLVARGFNAIRFNFRGVGASTGTYDDGVGEVDDVNAVCRYAKLEVADEGHLVAYFFGSWVALKAVKNGLDVESLTLIAPPNRMLDFSTLSLPDRPILVVVGDADSYCSISALEAWLKAQPQQADLDILRRTDHFFAGREEQLAERLDSFFGQG